VERGEDLEGGGGVSAKVSVSKVKDEALGEVYRVFVHGLPDGLNPVGFFVWRCPVCKRVIRAWTLGQLKAAAESHKMRRGHRKKSAPRGGENG
jgi:hypothetical protein